MLTMRLATHTMESVTLNYTLETFTFCGADNLHVFTFCEDFNSNSVANIFFFRIIAEFFYKSFGRGACFGEVIDLRLKRMLFVFIAKSQLECSIAITVFC